MAALTVAELIVDRLRRAGVTKVFGVVGTSILNLIDAIERADGIEFVSAREEASAVHMADGYARATGTLGVCVAHVGPGALKMLYGVGTPYKDSSPLLLITGNEVLKNLDRDGYHVIDVQALFAPVTKGTFRIESADRAADIIDRAIITACSGRPRPVHIDLPKDVSKETISLTGEELLNEALGVGAKPVTVPFTRPAPSREGLLKAKEMLQQSRRPVLFVGGGLHWSNAFDSLARFAVRHGIPVVTTDGGRGALPEDHPLCMGNLARQAGDAVATKVVREADLVIAIGLTFSDVSTLEWTVLSAGARLIRVDIAPEQLGTGYTPDLGFAADADKFLKGLDEVCGETDLDVEWDVGELKASLSAERAAYFSRIIDDPEQGVDPWHVIAGLDRLAPREAFISVDSGLHSFFGKKLRVLTGRSYIRSAGFGAMGYTVPAMLGACLAYPNRRGLAILGDGCFAMCMSELETAARLNLPVTILILNDGRFGSQHHHQMRRLEGRTVGTVFSNPDFAEIARSHGIKAWSVKTNEQLDNVLPEALNHPGPTLLDIRWNRAVVPGKWIEGSGDPRIRELQR